jgi:hypothetical protein
MVRVNESQHSNRSWLMNSRGMNIDRKRRVRKRNGFLDVVNAAYNDILRELL